LELAQNDEEKRLINISFQKIIRRYEERELGSLLDCIGQWAAALGVTKDITSVDVKMISTFIYNQFGNLTIKEIEYAIQLSLANKLDCDAELYGRGLSVSYVGKILSSYIEYKRSELRDLNYRLQLQKDSRTKEITPKDKMDSTKETIVMVYRDFEKTKLVNDPFNTIYNFLRKVKLLEPTKVQIAEAMEFGKKMAKQENDKLYGMYPSSRKEKEVDIDLVIKKYARNYCVGIYFEQNDLNLILSKINEEQFINNGDNR
jgi:hypothetical protein